jgi:hypothetical protein
MIRDFIERRQHVLLAALVLLSRLPFLSDGYGIDGDSWSVAITAGEIRESGSYVASRLPGFPLHEWVCALFEGYGYAGLNMLSAIFSAIAVLYFSLILRHLRFRYVFLASITFSLVPSFYIYSTTTIDYVIAVAFIMASMFYLLKGRLVAAGLMLGLAISTRITSGAMLVPFCILLFNTDGFANNVKRMMTLSVPAFILSSIFWLPVLLTYGSEFFMYYNVPYPTIQKILYKFSVEVWGVIGFIGIVVSTGLLFLPNRITTRKFLFPRGVNEKHVIAWLVAIDLYIIAFLKLPMESGYLIPVIPFVILIYGKYLYSKAFVFFCICLMLSAFIGNISPVERFDAADPSPASVQFNAGGERVNFDMLKGPVIAYMDRRRNGIEFVEGLIQSTDTITRNSVIIAGRWYNQIMVQSDFANLKADIRDYLSEGEAVYYYAKDYEIYFLPKQDVYNKIMRNVDLEIYGGRPYLNGEFLRFR